MGRSYPAPSSAPPHALVPTLPTPDDLPGDMGEPIPLDQRDVGGRLSRYCRRNEWITSTYRTRWSWSRGSSTGTRSGGSLRNRTSPSTVSRCRSNARRWFRCRVDEAPTRSRRWKTQPSPPTEMVARGELNPRPFGHRDVKQVYGRPRTARFGRHRPLNPRRPPRDDPRWLQLTSALLHRASPQRHHHGGRCPRLVLRHRVLAREVHGPARDPARPPSQGDA